MNEVQWAKQVAKGLQKELSSKDEIFSVRTGAKLIYANEIIFYTSEGPKYNEMSYETDILVSEEIEGKWIPRIVIETKISGITTHDAITYSNKAIKQ